ncbi:hypothetical protein RND81_01G209300 [Saponaria officinalis]|uniref:Uncharacterized protein n=1 Tax=Saponaria officinalis TaxID=3572 RepID=A0AAW1N8V6_SAPOF
MYNTKLTLLDRDIRHAFFKCRKWQLEETLDPINCPYHYYCNSHYSGDYPSWVDTLMMFFTALAFLTTLTTMVVGMIGRRDAFWVIKFRRLKRYFLPSGPIFLPIFLVILAKGYRINSVFPLTHTGPAILQLLRISALSFDTKSVSDVKYVFLEISTMSGILQAALYLDSIIMPYYTGVDALVSSRLSGECLSCVCRERVLVVGGTSVYRGWSVTTALIVGTLTLRIFSRFATETKRGTTFLKIGIESLSWTLMIVESLYLIIVVTPTDRSWITAVSFAAVFVLICLQILRRLVGLVLGFSFENLENKQRCIVKVFESQR